MNLHDIATAHWSNTEAVRRAVEAANDWLDTRPEGEQITTSALMRGLGVPLEDVKGFASKLTSARNNGMMPDRWKTDPKRKSFGHPAIIWLGTGLDAAIEQQRIEHEAANR